jgi:hypothetical protein
MQAKWHLIASLAIASASLLFNQDARFLAVELLGFKITVFVLCIAAGFFLDVDHLVDFRLNRGRFFKGAKGAYLNGRWFVIFHGIETIITLCGLSIAFPFLIFPTISYTCHMAMDIYSNGVPVPAYFYVVRLREILHANTLQIQKIP